MSREIQMRRLDLVLQLTGAPAGVAGEHAEPVQCGAEHLRRRVEVDDPDVAEQAPEADRVGAGGVERADRAA